MAPDHVKVEDCHEHRMAIYKMNFPRWALMLVILLVATLLGTLYTLNGRTSVAASDALKKAENNETRFAIEVEHLKEGQRDIRNDLKEQRVILHRIDKHLNGD